MDDLRADAEHWKRESDLRSGIINHLQTMLADVRAQIAAVERERDAACLDRDQNDMLYQGQWERAEKAYQMLAAAEQRVAALTEALRGGRSVSRICCTRTRSQWGYERWGYERDSAWAT